MKIRFLASFFLALASITGLYAQDAAPKPAPAAAKEESTPLEDTMDEMNGAFKALRKQIADASKNEDSLKRVAVLRAGAEEALKLAPAMKADKPAADQAKFVADYQAKMKATIKQIGKLETALKAGNNEQAAKLFAELKDMQTAGHKEFKRPPAKKN